MQVYLPTDSASHTMYVCPAADKTVGDDIPSEWVDADNKPLSFTVQFVAGRAEVPDSVGKYLVAKRLAAKTRLILP